MHQIADVLQFGEQASLDGLLVLLQIQLPDKLLPINQGFSLELAIVEEEVDFFGSESDVENPEGFFEHQIGDPSAFFFVHFLEGLF